MSARILTGLIAAIALWATAALHAAPVRQDPIQVDDAWARATTGTANTTAVYFRIRADPGRGDRLLAASSPLAETAELYSREMHDTTTAMRPVKGVDIPAGQTVTLAPGGRYILLTGLVVELKPGDHLPVVLLFADAGRVTISIPVLARSATRPETSR